MNKKLVGALLVSMAATIATADHHIEKKADGKAAEKAAEMACQNNTCKGKSECHGFGNSCAGQNSCKSKGIQKAKDKAACEKKGGIWTAAKE